ncbi:protein vestigial, putative [Pediculus humanus corporis]|uniref:Protein vestigial, putative n=1 Tax=Pediculus humanus subsp. corporis TaxID=121224 RepID=E0W347_PEDHC|nr:protein vestigial, putative [Pediculus humanus corporis]EEB20053.1 protein vestigial, putative [Pediculus humanus corporis]
MKLIDLNVQRSFQDHVHTNLTTTNLSGDTGYVSHHGHSQQSSAGSVGSSGPCNSPGSPGVRYKEENIRNSTSEGDIEDGGSDDEGSSSSRAQYVSANCVVFTHYTGDVAAVVDEHFTRALNYSEKSSSGSKDSSPMSSRNFPPSFWSSNYQSPTVSVSHHGELYSEYQHAAGVDPWHTHYQQYTTAAHHHRAVHDYHHHHHNTVAQYSGLLLPRASLAPQYGKDAWTSSHHTTRLHESAHSHTHFESAYSTYPGMSGKFIKSLSSSS